MQNNARAGPTLLCVDEVAFRYRIAASTLNRWRLRGKGPPFVRLGRRVFYEVDALEAWIAANRFVPSQVSSQCA